MLCIKKAKKNCKYLHKANNDSVTFFFRNTNARSSEYQNGTKIRQTILKASCGTCDQRPQPAHHEVIGEIRVKGQSAD